MRKISNKDVMKGDNMERISIFPALYSNREMVNYKHLLCKYTFVSAITAATPTPEIERVYHACPNIILTDDFEDGIKESDVILFLNGLSAESTALYSEYITIALKQQKKILLTRDLQALLQKYEIDIPDAEILSENIPPLLIDDLAFREGYLKRIEVPIIAVMGLGDYCGKFSCELALKDYFKQYNLLQYSSKEIGALFGFSELPEFVYQQNIPLTDRILKLNHFLYHQCVRENPDLLIIGFPEAIIPNNRKILNNFGEFSFIVSQAVLNIDIGIMCVYYNESFTAEYLQEYRNCCKYKLNCAADYFNIANTAILYDEISNESKLQYMFFSKDKVNENFPKFDSEDLCVFGIESDLNTQVMLDKIRGELTSNLNVF
ncbi:TIGR04066 family peptide maturation system protein [Paenibacillus graminis]|uniref:TIGR04066 family peptide maturation system protein n=1 Tax=Paenibacillus graminis TaxID=189425 RepID=UPI002DBB82F9|nr:TIGR04066 family peptide maturation system protein [Paenibacillus graminis]MEC0168819.1 TIGR04066 family peptide maturation system protein [Paenibacillus graminis]